MDSLFRDAGLELPDASLQHADMDKVRGRADGNWNAPACRTEPLPQTRTTARSAMGWLCAGLLLTLIPSVWGATSTSAAAKTLREQAVAVVFTVRIVPRPEAALASQQIHLRLPVNLPHQSITQLEVEGSPGRITDRWDSPVLVYQKSRLDPGEILTGRWMASARVREFQWELPQPASESRVSLSAEERSLYLRDAPGFALTNPVIREAAQQACAGRTNDLSRLEGIFDLVMERLQYDRDGKWQPAPEALAAGKGSCSEFSYAFIALCRAGGIPARYVGGIAGRAGAPFHLDAVFHRYPQAFVNGLGWIDFDPTRTDRAKNRRLYFGRTSPNMLLLCVGDGGEGSATGWDYLEAHRWAGRATDAARIRLGWWFPAPRPEVRLAIATFRDDLAGSKTSRSELVAKALIIDHPFVLPWLDDLLYEPAIRVEAARAMLKIGGNGALRAIVETLGRLRDQEGDRQIGELLNAFTGQNWGHDRAKWREWLKTRSATSPTSGPSRETQR